MKLVRARVTNYKSIDDSGWVTIDDVTSMVGKNESGKTAFLHALKRLNPVSGVNADFDLMDYPRKGYVQYKRTHKDHPAVAVRAEFELSDPEVAKIEAALGAGVLKSRKVLVSKDYENHLTWQMELDEQAVVKHILAHARMPVEIQQHVEKSENWQQLVACLENLPVKPVAVQALLAELPGRFKTELRQQIVDDYLMKFMPRFVYFDDYSAMRGRISIQEMRKRRDAHGQLDDADRTFLSLLSIVGAELEDLEKETNYEHLKAELESASIGISDEIFEFWQQNRQLRVQFDLSNANPNDPPPLNAGTILHVRIWNDRHRVSVPFDERSKGFVWFFSFLVYFSRLEAEEHSDLILLLDEPGLSLHAIAQADFLRFIDKRLAPKYRVIYTTHSPFMINLNYLSRVRTVQDIDNTGTVVSEDMLGNDRETVFPLQVALGFQVAQTLFLAPHCLMVKSPSDLVYLQVLGEVVASKHRNRLDPRWVAIPVGSADNLPTFVSLLGDHYVSVAVLMEVSPKSKEHFENLKQRGALKYRNPIKWLEVNRTRESDIEDLLDPAFYLKLVNEAYGPELPAKLTMKSISESSPRIANRVGAYFQREGIAGGHFDAYRPAAFLLERYDELSREIDDATIDRAAALFDRINTMIPATNGALGNTVNLLSARPLVTTA